MLDKKVKDKIITKFATRAGDTGSSNVQIALLTEEIKELAGHLKLHKHDFSSRRGLIRKVSQRRKILKYLEAEDPKSYDDIIKALKLKKRQVDVPKVELEEEDFIIKEEEPVEAVATSVE